MKDKKLTTTYVFKCAECGKKIEITVPSEYLHKIAKKLENGSISHDWFCSYRCMHEFKKKHKEYDVANKILEEIEKDKERELIKEARIEAEVQKRMKAWNEK